MDFGSKIQELVKTLRGSEASHKLSKELGYSYNIWSRWEDGSKNLLWDDLVLILQARGIAPATLLKNIFGLPEELGVSSQTVISTLLSITDGKASLNENFSSQKLRRLITQDTKLRVEDFLTILEALTGRSDRFFAMILGPEASAKLRSSVVENYIDFAGTEPLAGAVCTYLRLLQYKQTPIHSDEAIAKAFGVPQSQIANIIVNLERIGSIRKEGTHYQLVQDFVDYRAANSAATSKKIHRYWRHEIGKSHDSAANGAPSRTKSAFLLYETNVKLEKELFELANRFYLEFSNIVKQHSEDPPTDIKLLNLEFFSVLPTPAKEPSE